MGKLKWPPPDGTGALLALVLGGVISWTTFSLMLKQPSLCGDLPQASDCLREWIGATAGWAAASAALYTLLFLRRQIRALAVPTFEREIAELQAEQATIATMIELTSMRDKDGLVSVFGALASEVLTEPRSAKKDLEISQRIDAAVDKIRRCQTILVSSHGRPSDQVLVELRNQIGGALRKVVSECLEFRKGVMSEDFLRATDAKYDSDVFFEKTRQFITALGEIELALGKLQAACVVAIMKRREKVKRILSH